MLSPLLPRNAAAVAVLLLLLVTHTPISTHAQTALENGNEFESIKYTSPITYDANAKLKDETAYSSVIMWKSCTVSSKVTIKGTFATTKTFATSLYLMIDATAFSGKGQFYFNDLPPNSYVHAVGTTGSIVLATIFDIRPTTESNNITTLIDDSTIEYDSKVTEIQFVNLAVPDSSPFIVTHLRNAKLTSTYIIFKTTTCTKGSTIFIEKITCTACRWDLIMLTDISSISQQSAIIVKEITIIDHTRHLFDGLLRTGTGVDVDASSVLAVIDIDLTNDFKTKGALRLFYGTVLTGEGAIVFLRIKMGPSGLDSIQPQNNTNFWVVAMNTSARVMTADELREAKLNVNANNVINWDGTGSNGTCVQVGLALPGTATYELVNGKCEATCPQGNYLQPACTPRAVCTGVPNCQACYAHPKTLCLECLPHTTAMNGDTVCKCPIRECVTCPTATLCTNCTKDYKFSPEDNACFHCTIDKCAECKEDDQCATCQDGYKVYNNQCIACAIDKCELCKSPGKCAECIGDYTPNPTGNSCIQCAVPGCATCTADGVCGVCKDGYTFVPSATPTENKCVRCAIDVEHCKTCEVDSVCSECDAGYKLFNNGANCFQCTISACTGCSADGVCAACKAGYSLVQSSSTPTDNKCVRCTEDIPKCAFCEVDSVCSKCDDDYKLANSGKNCFHCMTSNCTECSADGVCAVCKPGYSLVQSSSTPTDNKCVRCTADIPKCAFCEVDSVCSKCDDEYKLANSGKNCFHCTASNCTECSADGVCAVCKPGYLLVQSSSTPTDNKCVRCTADIPKCAFCEVDSVCSKCDDDYKLANNGKNCFHCTTSNCTECSADGVCAVCKPGYSLVHSPTNPKNNKCVRCAIDIPNCESCETDGVCSKCDDEYKLADNGKNCFHCTMPGCEVCRADSVCAACEDGYTLLEYPENPTNNRCVGCSLDIENCLTCKDDGVCAECGTGYKPGNDGKNCFQCAMSDCTECSADGVCAVCKPGYSLVQSPTKPTDNKCVRCTIDVPNCVSCKTDGICSECKLDYKLTNGGTSCFQCTIQNCTECSADGVCAACEEGYSLTDNECVRCRIDIPNCDFCKTEGTCAVCSAGHIAANGGTNCFHCAMPDCTECSADGVCAVCKDGYSLVESVTTPTDNKCVRCAIDVPDCKHCEADSICSECSDGYQLSTDTLRCTLCEVAGCKRCDLPGVCALCHEGMTANEHGQCTPCAVDGCAHCSGNNTCAVCACGQVPSKDGKTCVPCSVSSCSHCDPSGGGSKCAECVPGYEKTDDGGACKKVLLPEWVVFVIVVASSTVLMIALVVAYILYQRHEAKAAQVAADAEERRRNRQARGNASRIYAGITVLDLGDIEGAASGVRDTIKLCAL